MIQPQLMQQRGVNVMNMNRMLHGTKPKLIGLAMNHAASKSASGEPHRERIDVMIPARRFPDFPHRRPPKLAAPKDNGIIEQSPLFQIEH